MGKSILVPVDGSEHSKKALEFALELCAGLGGSITLLHVAQSVPADRTLILGGAAVTIEASREELNKAGRQVIDAAVTMAKGQNCQVSAADVMRGDPAAQIVAQAKSMQADLIVMGSRGLSDLAGLVLGSVSHKVNPLSSCTCILVK